MGQAASFWGNLLDWMNLEGGPVEVSQVGCCNPAISLGHQHAVDSLDCPAQRNQFLGPVDDLDQVEGVNLQKAGVLLRITVHHDRVDPRLGAAAGGAHDRLLIEEGPPEGGHCCSPEIGTHLDQLPLLHRYQARLASPQDKGPTPGCNFLLDGDGG